MHQSFIDNHTFFTSIFVLFHNFTFWYNLLWKNLLWTADIMSSSVSQTFFVRHKENNNWLLFILMDWKIPIIVCARPNRNSKIIAVPIFPFFESKTFSLFISNIFIHAIAERNNPVRFTHARPKVIHRFVPVQLLKLGGAN